MGSWGTGISSNDTFEDIKYEFFELYNDGLEPDEITKKLTNTNRDLIESEEDANNFWFALALCQWECKSLVPELLERVTKIVNSGADIELWKELGAEKAELTKRKKALDNFLDKLNSEKKSPKRRKKKVFRDSIFKKGDCLSIELSNRSFGAAFVLEAEEKTEYGLNLIATCEYNSTEPPTTKFFEQARVLISKEQESRDSFGDYPVISWYMADQFKSGEFKINKVGQLKVAKHYNPDTHYVSFAPWKFIPSRIENQPQLVSKHGAINMELKLKSLRKKTWL